MSTAWLRLPDEIYARSFAIIRAEAELDRLPPALVPLALRVVHACGMVEVASRLAWQGDPAAAGRTALARGRPVIADCRMVASGIIRRRLPAGTDILCGLDRDETAAIAALTLAVQHLRDR